MSFSESVLMGIASLFLTLAFSSSSFMCRLLFMALSPSRLSISVIALCGATSLRLSAAAISLSAACCPQDTTDNSVGTIHTANNRPPVMLVIILFIVLNGIRDAKIVYF